MKILIILLMFGCIALSILAIINTIRLKKLQKKSKTKFYRTPKLSELHEKDFSNYIDYLTRDL